MQGEKPEPGERRSVQSVEVGGRLLLALAERPMSMTLKDLAVLADLAPSRAYTYLVAFGRLGFVEQDTATGRYALGPAAFQLGLSCLHQSDPVKAASTVCEALVRRIDQSVAIAVWANFGPTIVRMIDGSRPLHVSMRAGTVMSLFGTATGRAFAAVMPQKAIEHALTAPSFGGLVSGPPLQQLALKRTLEQIAQEVAERGVARAAGRPIPGVNAFSAVARNHEGTPVLVITALGHEDDFDVDWDSPIAQAVIDAAADVSTRMGYRKR